jgi:DNA-binding transcriptional LysR family regulator
MQRWDDLRVFLALVEAGTFAGAAELLGINGSTVLRRVRTLENDLGATLFERGARGTRLTPAGEALLPRAQAVEDAAHAARRAVAGHDRELAGEVRLTLVEDLLPIVGPLLDEVRREAPGIVPVLTVGAERLEIGRQADVAFRFGDEIPATAVARKLASVAWTTYTSRPEGAGQHAPAWLDYDGLDDVPAVRWFRRTHPEAQVVGRVDGVSAMHRLLQSMPACALLPCHLGDPDPALRRLEPPAEGPLSTLWLLIHADLRRSVRVRALVDLLVPRIVAQRDLFAGRCGPETD